MYCMRLSLKQILNLLLEIKKMQQNHLFYRAEKSPSKIKVQRLSMQTVNFPRQKSTYKDTITQLQVYLQAHTHTHTTHIW